MSAKPDPNASEVAFLVERIVERCREDGQLVTVNYHYPKGWTAINYGWQLGIGLSSGVGFTLLLGAGIQWLLS